MSTRWDLLESEQEQQLKILEKVRSFFSTVVSTVAWKDEEEVRRFSERWSILFSCWECIPRNVRPLIMKKLLSEEDQEFLRKLSRRIIVGKVKVGKTVLESAFNFYLKYIPSLSDGSRPLEEILDWKALICLQSASVSLDAALAQLSVQRMILKNELTVTTSNCANVEFPQKSTYDYKRNATLESNYCLKHYAKVKRNLMCLFMGWLLV